MSPSIRHVVLALGFVASLLLPASVAAFVQATGGAERARLAWTILLPSGLASFVLVLWFMFVANLMAQNVPAHARLVPGQPRALRRGLLSVWAAIVLLAALWAAALGFAPAWPAAAVATGFAGLAWILRAPSAGPLFGLAMAALGLSGTLADLFKAARASEVDFSLGPVIVILLSAAALYRLIDDGGDAHVRRFESDVFQRTLTQSQSLQTLMPQATQPQGPCWWMQPGMTLYRWWLARVLGQTQPPQGSRVMLVFGPRVHWALLAGGLLMAAGVLALLLLMAWVWPSSLGARGATVIATLIQGGAVGAAASVLGHVWALRQAMWATRGEQALLMLAPGVPRGAYLNRMLAARYSLQAALFALLILVGVASPWLLPRGGSIFPIEVLYAALALQPLTWLLLWIDWSRVAGASGGWLLAGAFIALGPIAAAILVAARWTSWPLTLAVAAAALGVIGALRWARLGRAPTALPVGWMAGRR